VTRVSDHLSEVLGAVGALDPIDVGLLDAHGAVAAEDVIAPWALPQYDHATTPGYAVRASDVVAARPDKPVTLPVVADIDAGDRGANAIGAGHAARVASGAPLPRGADAVVALADTDGGVASVGVTAAVPAGSWVRRKAEDVEKGDIALRVGTYLGAAQIGLLAAVGKDRVTVRPRPRVVVIAAGSRLVEPGRSVAFGQVTDSTGPLLTAASREAGANAFRVAAIPDDPRIVRGTLEDQLIRADLVVTSGGLAAPDGVMRQVVPDMGSVRFVDVDMEPGSQQAFGVVGDEQVPIFCLPGRPVDAFVAFEVFVRPVIRKMVGVTRLHRPTVRATLTGDIESATGPRQFARARVWASGEDEYRVEPLGALEAPHLTDLARANALIVVPEATSHLPAEAEVDCLLLERRRG
jgi:molybdopterin molybdotransferase